MLWLMAFEGGGHDQPLQEFVIPKCWVIIVYSKLEGEPEMLVMIEIQLLVNR
jgi:hypothetical protein